MAVPAAVVPTPGGGGREVLELLYNNSIVGMQCARGGSIITENVILTDRYTLNPQNFNPVINNFGDSMKQHHHVYPD